MGVVIAAMKLLAFACASLAFASDGCANDGSYPWKNKPNYCTDVTMYQTRTNSWVCRNCFNIRLEFNLGWIGAVGYWWDNRDSIYFAFKDPVSAIKAAGPALTPVAIPDKDGLYRYRMDFNKQAQFGDGRIDINVEFNDNDTDGELAWVYTCPCGTGTKKDKEPTPTDAPEDDDEEPVTDAPEDDDDDEEPVTDAPEDDPVKPDGCDPKGIDFPEPPAEGGFWNCGWHRKGPVQQRMNRCHWECFGEDPVDDSDNWVTGAKVRCFREQGRKFRAGTRKFRELFTWKIGGNKDHQVEKISCDPQYAKKKKAKKTRGGGN